MRRRARRLTKLVLLAFLVTAAPCSLSGKAYGLEQAEGVPLSSAEEAVLYVEQLLTGDAAALEGQYLHTEELLAALQKSGGFAGLQKQLKGLGKLKETGPVLVRTIGEYTSYGVPCRFFLQKLNLVLNVDKEGRIAGIVTAEYEEGRAEEESSPAQENFREKQLNLPVEGLGELEGLLTLPENEGVYPAVVLVHGSGPQDMDETLGENKPFKDLAEGLAEEGIAVYRYDKRTYTFGGELQEDTDLTLLEETVEDAANAVRLLSGQEEIDPERIFVLGHSLGGQAIPAIDQSLDGLAAGYIFLAAPARDLLTILREQYDFIYSLPTSPSGVDAEAQKAAVYALLDLLEEPGDLPEDEPVLGAYPAYWTWMAEYDALAEAQTIDVPCLVLQGEEDYQVSMEDFALWQEAFGDDPAWSFTSYPGLSHIFAEGKREEAQASYLGARKMDERVIRDIAEFILE